MTNMVDAAGTTKYTYYAGALLNAEDGPWTSDTVTYSYNNARLPGGLTLQQPTGSWTNGFNYDAAHRLSTVVFAPDTFTYTYIGARSLWTNLALPNTSKITNSYDSVGRLTGTYLVTSGGSVLNKHEYLYNTGNQRIRHTRTDGSYYTNNYDNIGQLKVADNTTASEDRYYGYDASWNLNKRTNNTTVYTFSVDGKNQLTSAPNGNCSYDSNGNLTANGILGYGYDAENQLTNTVWIASDSLSGQRSDFSYDGRGRLRKRLDYFWQNTGGTNGVWSANGEVRYVYDGMRVIQERSSANTPTVTYTRGSDLSGTMGGAGGIGGLLARSHNYVSGTGAWNSHGYYHADGGGNITYLANPSQGLAASYKYDPFGNTITFSGTNASANVYRFSSKEYMATAANYYYGYRFYDPNLQRWLIRDPLGDEARLIAQLRGRSGRVRNEIINYSIKPQYVFADNSPFDFGDQVGLWTIGFGIQIKVCIVICLGADVGFYYGRSKEKGKSKGILGGPSIGAGGPVSISGGGFLQGTTAKCVSDLKGLSARAGGSAGEFYTGGGDLILGPSYWGGQLSGGFGGGLPAEGHVEFGWDQGWDSQHGIQ